MYAINVHVSNFDIDNDNFLFNSQPYVYENSIIDTRYQHLIDNFYDISSRWFICIFYTRENIIRVINFSPSSISIRVSHFFTLNTSKINEFICS